MHGARARRVRPIPATEGSPEEAPAGGWLVSLVRGSRRLAPISRGPPSSFFSMTLLLFCCLPRRSHSRRRARGRLGRPPAAVRARERDLESTKPVFQRATPTQTKRRTDVYVRTNSKKEKIKPREVDADCQQRKAEEKKNFIETRKTNASNDKAQK